MIKYSYPKKYELYFRLLNNCKTFGGGNHKPVFRHEQAGVEFSKYINDNNYKKDNEQKRLTAREKPIF